MLEPLTIGAHAAAKLELAPGDRVLVTGAGPIGISCALNAQTYGARVLLSDTNPGRRAFAAERFRLLALDPLDEHFTEQTAQFTENSLFDAVIDTTAAKASMEQTWRWINCTMPLRGHGTICAEQTACCLQQSSSGNCCPAADCACRAAA